MVSNLMVYFNELFSWLQWNFKLSSKKYSSANYWQIVQSGLGLDESTGEWRNLKRKKHKDFISATNWSLSLGNTFYLAWRIFIHRDFHTRMTWAKCPLCSGITQNFIFLDKLDIDNILHKENLLIVSIFLIWWDILS